MSALSLPVGVALALVAAMLSGEVWGVAALALLLGRVSVGLRWRWPRRRRDPGEIEARRRVRLAERARLAEREAWRRKQEVAGLDGGEWEDFRRRAGR